MDINFTAFTQKLSNPKIKDELKDNSIVIQGFGNVGSNLAKHLYNRDQAKIVAVGERQGYLYNENGNIEYSSGNLIVNSDYKDTLTFIKGCYTFVMNDTDEDGLDIDWLNGEGAGMVRFREIGASWLKAFNANFGTNIIHQFSVGNAQNTTSAEQNSNWEIFPNPTKKILTIEGISNEKTKLTLQDNLGKIILERTITNSGFTSEIINLEQFENGIYFIKISNSKEEITKKVVKI